MQKQILIEIITFVCSSCCVMEFTPIQTSCDLPHNELNPIGNEIEEKSINMFGLT